MSLLLGVPDSLVKKNETTTWETNKIGGIPDWFQANTPIPCCRKCQREMTLATQIYCPLTHSRFHRCLHIFVCPWKPCSTHSCGWSVIRTQQLDDSSPQQSQASCAADDKWTDDQDDWGIGQIDWGEDEEEEEKKEGEDDTDSQVEKPEEEDPEDPSLETMTARISEMSVSGQDHPTVAGAGRACSSPGRSSTDEASPAPDGNLHGPAALQGDNSMELLATADIMKFAQYVTQHRKRRLKTQQAIHTMDSALPGAGQGDAEPSLPVEAETMAVDGEGLQRMMGLLAAATEGCGKSEESDSKKMEDVQRETFPAYYLNVMAKRDVEASSDDHVTTLLRDYQQSEGVHFSALLSEAGKGGQSEKYDRTEVKHGDRHCYKFIKRLQDCPQQCIRYQWLGSPLLMSGGSPTADRCQKCDTPRVFELQLMPPLLPFLTFPSHTEPQVEFGTVLVFTCGASCWSDAETHIEETVLLQHDSEHHLFK